MSGFFFSPAGGSDAGVFLPEEAAAHAVYNATDFSVIGCTMVYAGAPGRASATYATTNHLTQLTRITTQPANSANSASSMIFANGAAFLSRGFEFKCIFGVETALAGSRLLVGFHLNYNGISDPSANNAGVHVFALAADEGDSNLQIITRDGATSSKIDLGSSFPKATAGATYKVEMEMPAGGANATYTITRLDSAASATATITANIPNTSSGLTRGFYNGAGAGAGIVKHGVVIQWFRPKPL